MSKLHYFLLCENTILDKSDRVSIINIFDNVQVTALPVNHPHFVITFRFEPDAKEKLKKTLRIGLVIIGPGGGEFLKAEMPVNVNDQVRSREGTIASSLDLAGLVFEKEGAYEAKLLIDDTQIGNKEFNVTMIKKQVEL